MNLRWRWILVPPLVIALMLLAASQFFFLRGSLYQDLGVGRLGDTISATNYVHIFSDSFYLGSLWLTVKLSATATLATLVFGFPVAYVLARMRSHWGSRMLALILAASFVTIVIKVLGLNLIFASSGGLNRMLLQTGLVHDPVSLLGTHAGVVVGLMHFSLAFIVVLLYSVILTIPVSLEEAAQNLGASRWRMHQRVTLPIALPGIVASCLIVFNLCMGAFTSAALLGAGKVLTLPVLIQRTVIFDTKYGMGAALAGVLLIAGLAINLLSLGLVTRLKSTRGVAA